MGFFLDEFKNRFNDKKVIVDNIKNVFEDFVKTFEIYCGAFVNNLPIVDSNFERNIRQKNNGNIDFVTIFNRIREDIPDVLPLWGFDKVLSFNYTNTYERVYVNEKELRQNVTGEPIDSQKEPEICYIHGKAGEGNIIIGIDEYLTDGRENTDFSFIEFKKYYQRIDKRTGSTYKDWIRNNEKKTVYYMGHSFAETDHDILREFLMDDNTQNTILYHEPSRKRDLMQKVIKIIGKDELIKRVHGSKWNIRFEPQEEFLFSENNTVFTDTVKKHIILGHLDNRIGMTV
jgi:hypothetical protein